MSARCDVLDVVLLEPPEHEREEYDPQSGPDACSAAVETRLRGVEIPRVIAGTERT